MRNNQDIVRKNKLTKEIEDLLYFQGNKKCC